MRMKENAMKNGQLKPVYNVQNGVDAEYITWLTVNVNIFLYKKWKIIMYNN